MGVGEKLVIIQVSNHLSSIHIGGDAGDVKLTNLKVSLEEAGISSQWSGPGALVCGKHTLVRKSGDESGDLLLEGALGSDYYRIRDILYSQYHVC